jgi:hypothetical protein
MKTMWDGDAARSVRDRIGTLTPGHTARWGRMSAPQVVCHLADSLRMALGELAVAPKNLPIRYPPLKQLIIYVAPFPKSAPTAPELLARAPSEWNADVSDLRSLIDRFAARGPNATWVEHPAFGKLSGRAWGALAYRHMDHHLKQFGV